MKTLGICSDHAGYELKEIIKGYLKSKDINVIDFGTNSNESCDYADFAHPMASALEEGKFDNAISICGSGNGINMTVNKHQAVRSALCWNSEIAKLAREHNDANICSLPARFITIEEAKAIVDIFLSTSFEGGRHQKRIDKIPLSTTDKK